MSAIIRPVQAMGAQPEAQVDGGGQSLEGRMLSELARCSEVATERQNNLAETVSSASDDPMRLLRAQADLAKFHIEMSLSSALARKGVSVVETLVKA